MVFRHPDWFSKYRHLYIGLAKNTRVVLRKWSSRDKYLKYQNLPTHFRLPLSKIGQIYTPHKFTQSGCIPPKLKCEILAHKGLQTARRLSRLLEPQTNRTTGPPNVTDYGSRFPGKRNPLLTRLFCFFFFISIAKWSVKEDDTMMNKVAKGKEKTRGNNKKKNAKCAVEQDYESTYSFQNCDSRQLFSIQMFLY